MSHQLNDIKTFFLKTIKNSPEIAVNYTAHKFKITRQAVNKHVQQLIDMNLISLEGKTKAAKYSLVQKELFECKFTIDENSSESQVWNDSISKYFEKLPKNVYEIWQHGFTEMYNNVIDHSESSSVRVRVKCDALEFNISIIDEGVGIFKKIKEANNLSDERHSVLELAKGKFTTDPVKHSGEGIFFTSRIFDDFIIISGEVLFANGGSSNEDWIIDPGVKIEGTLVSMTLANDSKTSLMKVFDEYAHKDNFTFSKTVVPVRLAQLGDTNLISRSQAKRLLARFDMFSMVILDFSGVESVGQAFADEVFRVFRKQHPEVEIVPRDMSENVDKMVMRAMNNKM